MAQRTTAGLVVIGNEILSGKVADTNTPFLAGQLREAGVSLERIIVIPDEIEVIGATVREFRAAYDLVFTSGGVGPTHDDVTIAGIARGLGKQVIRHPELERVLRDFFGDKINEPRLRMAEVVEGTELVSGGDLKFPTLQIDNIYVLPGIPEIFRDKVVAIRHRFSTDPFHLRVIYSRDQETSIVGFLNRTMEKFPDLLLGSYPKLNDPEYRVRITLESKDQDYVEGALRMLLELLPPASVVRHE
jgi:molybdenum cofactor synthesis domain-containing protein